MRTDAALDTRSYPDPGLDPARAHASFVSRAVFNGIIVCAALPRAVVARALPEQLRLASTTLQLDWHPVLFVLGDQTRGASRLFGVDVEWGAEYQELVMAVPFVAPRRTGRLSVYAAAMYSSYAIPNWVGRVAYGYNKRLGVVQRRGPIMALTTPEEGLVFQVAVEASGPWGRPADTTPAAVSTLQRVAELPWIGCKPNGLLVQSYSTWMLGDAQTRSIEARAMLHRSVVVGFPTGNYESVRGASVEVQGMTWWLSWPRTCVF